MTGHHHGAAGIAQTGGFPQVPTFYIPVQESRAEGIAGAEDILNRDRKSRHVLRSAVTLMNPASGPAAFLQHHPRPVFHKGPHVFGGIPGHPGIGNLGMGQQDGLGIGQQGGINLILGTQDDDPRGTGRNAQRRRRRGDRATGQA